MQARAETNQWNSGFGLGCNPERMVVQLHSPTVDESLISPTTDEIFQKGSACDEEIKLYWGTAEQHCQKGILYGVKPPSPNQVAWLPAALMPGRCKFPYHMIDPAGNLLPR